MNYRRSEAVAAASSPMRDYVELALAGKFDEAQKIADEMQPMRVALERRVAGAAIQ